jgi:hypothetical protein
MNSSATSGLISSTASATEANPFAAAMAESAQHNKSESHSFLLLQLLVKAALPMPKNNQLLIALVFPLTFVADIPQPMQETGNTYNQLLLEFASEHLLHEAPPRRKQNRHPLGEPVRSKWKTMAPSHPLKEARTQAGATGLEYLTHCHMRAQDLTILDYQGLA